MTQVLERDCGHQIAASDIAAELALQKIENAIQAFSDAVDAHDYLEIDGVLETSADADNAGWPAAPLPSLKVLNHDRRTAYCLSLKAVVDQALDEVIKAIETGVTQKLYGITRIVGYYSRTSNWNKSKLGELKDRAKGNYSVKAIAGE